MYKRSCAHTFLRTFPRTFLTCPRSRKVVKSNACLVNNGLTQDCPEKGRTGRAVSQ